MTAGDRSGVRAARAREAARRVAEAVGRTAPPQIGRWDPAWAIVEGPSKAFLDALGAWERTGSASDAAAAKAAGNAVVCAWRDAAIAWEAAGRPAAGEGARRRGSAAAPWQKAVR